MSKESKKSEDERLYDLTSLGDSGALLETENPSANNADKEENGESTDKSEVIISEEPDEESKTTVQEEEAPEPEKDEEEERSEGDVPEERRLPIAVRLVRFAADILSGDCDETQLSKWLDAATAREEVEAARSEVEAAYQRGLIDGRNEQIEERLEMPPVGAPDLCGAPPVRTGIGNSIFDLAREAK